MMNSRAAFGVHEREVWIGDFPKMNLKQFRLMILSNLPYGVPRGNVNVKKFVAKRYRMKETKKWSGYGILECANTELKDIILAHFNRLELKISNTQVTLRAQPAVADTQKTAALESLSTRGKEPSLHQQLSNVPLIDLTEKAVKLGLLTAETVQASTRRDLLKSLLDHYTNHPRSAQRHEGVDLPMDIKNKLLAQLEKQEFPPGTHRPSVLSQHYIVLKTGAEPAEFLELAGLCRELMNWADADFPYTAIAVTKNFHGSPHVDAADQMAQFCVSLGEFNDGGELFVDSPNPDEVLQVVTKNKVAKVDGRYTHWVNGYIGTRYSLIFYCSDIKLHLPRVQPLHIFCPREA